MYFIIKPIILYILLAFPHNVFSQVPDTILPPPPPPPLPEYKIDLSEEEKNLIDSIQNEIIHSRNNLSKRFTQLSSIVLDKDAFNLFRIKAIELVARLSTIESEYFLLEHIDLYIYNEKNADSPLWYENIPIYFEIRKQPFEIFNFLFKTNILQECLSEQKLKLYANLLNIKYKKRLSLAIIETKLETENNKCVLYNLEFIKKELKRKH